LTNASVLSSSDCAGTSINMDVTSSDKPMSFIKVQTQLLVPKLRQWKISPDQWHIYEAPHACFVYLTGPNPINVANIQIAFGDVVLSRWRVQASQRDPCELTLNVPSCPLIGAQEAEVALHVLENKRVIWTTRFTYVFTKSHSSLPFASNAIDSETSSSSKTTINDGCNSASVIARDSCGTKVVYRFPSFAALLRHGPVSLFMRRKPCAVNSSGAAPLMSPTNVRNVGNTALRGRIGLYPAISSAPLCGFVVPHPHMTPLCSPSASASAPLTSSPFAPSRFYRLAYPF